MTGTSLWNRGFCVWLALGLFGAGCNRPTAPNEGNTPASPAAVSAGNGTTTWTRIPNQRPGVDSASVDMCTWGDGLVFVVWSDARTSAGGSQQTESGVAYFGSYPMADGRQVEYRGETTDGKTGKVLFQTKDGRTGVVTPLGYYDLGEGSLFLVATGGKRPRVLQMKRDIQKARLEGFQKLGEADAEIGQFFAQAEDKS